MNKLKPTLHYIAPILGSLLIVSCGAPHSAVSGEADTAQLATSPTAEGTNEATEVAATQTTVPTAPPQLIKTAELTLRVDLVEDAIAKAQTVAKQQQGDTLSLEESRPENSWNRPQASMQLRVPQANLEATLNALSELGAVQNQNISAQDVSNQLVDFQARLRNLRKTESTLLGIMERSGSVGDVLKVSQELSNTRSQIEQIDAQLKDLRNRVAFSTITLKLEAAVATTPAGKPLGSQLGESWRSATHSVGEFTSGLLKLGIWLLAYSPYLFVMGGGTWLGWKQLKKRRNSLQSAPVETQSDW